MSSRLLNRTIPAQRVKARRHVSSQRPVITSYPHRVGPHITM